MDDFGVGMILHNPSKRKRAGRSIDFLERRPALGVVRIIRGHHMARSRYGHCLHGVFTVTGRTANLCGMVHWWLGGMRVHHGWV